MHPFATIIRSIFSSWWCTQFTTIRKSTFRRHDAPICNHKQIHLQQPWYLQNLLMKDGALEDMRDMKLAFGAACIGTLHAKTKIWIQIVSCLLLRRQRYWQEFFSCKNSLSFATCFVPSLERASPWERERERERDPPFTGKNSQKKKEHDNKN